MGEVAVGEVAPGRSATVEAAVARGPAPQTWSGRRWLAAVLGIVALGLVVRAFYVLVVLDDVTPGLDASAYQMLGGSIRDGTGYVVPTSIFTGEYTPTAGFPPLYPAYQALWQSAVEPAPASVRMAGLVPAAITIALTAVLGRRLVSPRVGLVAAAVVAVHPGLVAADGSGMSENLTVPLVVAAQVLALALVDAEGDAGRDPEDAGGDPGHGRVGRIGLAAGLGLVLGLAILTRQDLALVGGFLGLWVLVAMRGSWRAKAMVAGVVAIGAALVVTPWVVRNADAVDVAAVSTLSPSSALAGANCPSAYHGPDIGAWDYGCVTAARGGITESEAAERGIPERELADDYRSAGTTYIRDNLSRLPIVLAARELRGWSLWDPRVLARADSYESRSYAFQVRARPIEAAVALAGAVGLVVLARRQRLRSVVAVAPVVAVILSMAASYGNPRFNATAQTSLAIGVAVLAAALLGRWRHRSAAE